MATTAQTLTDEQRYLLSRPRRLCSHGTEWRWSSRKNRWLAVAVFMSRCRCSKPARLTPVEVETETARMAATLVSK